MYNFINISFVQNGKLQFSYCSAIHSERRLYDAERFLAFCQTKPKICVKRFEPTIAAPCSHRKFTSFRSTFMGAPGASLNSAAKTMKMRIFLIPLEIILLGKTLSWPQNAIFARSNLTIFDVVVCLFSGMRFSLQWKWEKKNLYKF